MLLYLLLLALIASIAAGWVCCALGFGVAKIFRQPETARQIGRIWGWTSIPTALSGAFVCWAFFPPAPLLYWQEFGESPLSKARDMQGFSSGSFDGESLFLRFQAAPSTVQRLASNKHLPLSGSVPDFGILGVTPSWWKPTASSSVYALEQHPKGYSCRGTFLIYEPQTQTAYYAFSSVN